jgi:ADP-ribosyl-[dinitrogen reductase] hydrolase
LAGKRFVCPDPEAALAEIGATTVVCLCEAEELAERYPGYVDWLGANRDSRAVWFPVADLHAPAVACARTFLDGLGGRLASGEGLLMHCGAGMGRAGTMAAGLLLTMGAGLGEALATVAGARPQAGPEAGAQKELLLALEAGVSPPDGPRPSAS